MCRIDERVYIRTDGHKSVFQDTTLCDKGRHRGTTCTDARVRRTEYPDPIRSPIASSPITPPFNTPTRRPSISTQPSTRDAPITSLKPEISIEIGSKKGRRKSYMPAVSITTGKQKRHAFIQAVIDDSESEGSKTTHSESLDSWNPPWNPSLPTAPSNRFPYTYGSADVYNTPSLNTGKVAASDESLPHTGRGQSSAPRRDARRRTESLSYPMRTTESLEYVRTDARLGHMRRGSFAPELIGHDEDRRDRREEQQRRQDASDREAAMSIMREEASRRPSFKNNRAKVSDGRQAQESFDAYEQRRAEDREQLRRERNIRQDTQGAEESTAPRPKQSASYTKSRKLSIQLTAAQIAEIQHLVAAEAFQTQQERIKAEPVEREEQSRKQNASQSALREHQPLSFPERQQDPDYYETQLPRAPLRHRTHITRRPSELLLPHFGDYSAGLECHLPSLYSDNPSAPRQSAPVPWELLHMSQALPDQTLPSAKTQHIGHNSPQLQQATHSGKVSTVDEPSLESPVLDIPMNNDLDWVFPMNRRSRKKGPSAETLIDMTSSSEGPQHIVEGVARSRTTFGWTSSSLEHGADAHEALNMSLIGTGMADQGGQAHKPESSDAQATGGLSSQDNDLASLDPDAKKITTDEEPSTPQHHELPSENLYRIKSNDPGTTTSAISTKTGVFEQRRPSEIAATIVKRDRNEMLPRKQSGTVSDGESDRMPAQSPKDTDSVIDNLQFYRMLAEASMMSDQEDEVEGITHETSEHLPVDDEVLSTKDMWHDEEDDVSTGSTYAASIFSLESLATDATGLSQASGYTRIQIATATKVLVSTLQDDDVLVPLYQRAIASPAIGPARLQRNLYKLFKYYARNLGEEYAERLEYLASRLVAIRARYIAKSIVEKYCFGQSLPHTNVPKLDVSSEEDSDDDFGSSTVQDKDFDDLQTFRQFLVGSNAFVTLRTQIQTFVVPKTSRSADLDPANSGLSTKGQIATFSTTWQGWRADFAQAIDLIILNKENRLAVWEAMQLTMNAFMLATDKIFIATGILEPPLAPSLVRLRWTCDCGDQLFDDVAELQPNGIKDLIALMEGSGGVKVTATPYRQNSSSQRYAGSRHLRWFGGGSTSCHGSQQRDSKNPASQSHAASVSVDTGTTTQSSSITDPLLHLMACVDDKSSDTILLQDRIRNIVTDKALMQFLRAQYRRHRSRLHSLLSFKCLQGIHFVHFHLPLGDSAIIIPHETTCNQARTPACECLPPLTRVSPSGTSEYFCCPVPPKTFPPIPPKFLLSYFTCVKEPHPSSRWMVDQFPKRSWGELFGGAEQPAEGWGIYYKEGWDPKMIVRAVLGLLLASLVFGAVWTKVRGDVQGAFGVAAWIVGVGGAGLGVLVTSVNSS